MMRLFFTEIAGCGSGIDDVFPGLPEELGESDLLLVSRMDIDVQLLTAPRVKQCDLPALVSYRLRAIYPGGSDRTVFDQRVCGDNRTSLIVAVYSMRSDVYERYRAFAIESRLITADSLGRFLLVCRGAEMVIVLTSRYAEVITYLDGQIRFDCMMNFDDSPSVPERILGLLPGTLQESLFIIDTESGGIRATDLGDRLSPLARRISVMPLQHVIGEVESRRRGRMIAARIPRIFCPSAQVSIRSRRLAVVLLVALFAVLSAEFVWYGVRVIRTYASIAEGMAAEYQTALRTLAKAAAKRNEYTRLVEELNMLRGRRTVDHTRFFTQLAGAGLGLQFVLQSASIADGRFAIEGWAANPYTLVDRLSVASGFAAVFLDQAVSDDVRKLARFSVKGTFDAG